VKKLFYYWKELIGTFWFLPIAIITANISVAVLLLNYDSQSSTDYSQSILRYFFIDNIDSAQSILTTIATAMIGVAGTVFSITLVALTLASSQFGPRLIRNFMYDRINQIVLGSYVSLFIYCLIILNSVSESDKFQFVPSFSIFFALIESLVNIIFLIVFIHHISTNIQADKVISRITSKMIENIQNLFPEKLGKKEEQEKINLEEVQKSYTDQVQIKAKNNGFLRYIDGDSLIEKIKKVKGVIKVHYRPGQYILYGSNIAVVYLNDRNSSIEKDCEDLFILGSSRSEQQDAEYSILQMVEIASRAISPGINDPFTAIACINNLAATLNYLCGVNFPSNYRFDDEGELRMVVHSITFGGMLDASFNQIRQFGKAIPSVMIRMVEVLVYLNEIANSDAQKEAIKKHIEMLINTAENNFEETKDLEDLKKRCKDFL